MLYVKYTVNGLRLQANVASAVLTPQMEQKSVQGVLLAVHLPKINKERKKERKKETKTLDEI